MERDPGLWILTLLAALGQPALGVVLYNLAISSLRESFFKKAAALVNLPLGCLLALAIAGWGLAGGRAETWFYRAAPGPWEFILSLYLYISAVGGAAALAFIVTNPRRRFRPAGERSNHTAVVRLPRSGPWPYSLPRRAALALFAPVNQLTDLEINEKEVTLPNLPAAFDGVRLAQFSDLHIGTALEDSFYLRAIEEIRARRPDLIAFTGDFVSRSAFIPKIPEILRGLAAPLGVFVVRGNHDFWTRPLQIRTICDDLGFTTLDNRAVILRRGAPGREDAIALIGVEHPFGERIRDWSGVIPPGLPPCRIALLHTPDVIRHVAARGCDLALAGHTHGGQAQLPFIGVTISPSLYGRRYAEGWKRVGQTLLYTNRGLGAFFPVRILCRPEITIFTLRRPAALAADGGSTDQAQPAR